MRAVTTERKTLWEIGELYSGHDISRKGASVIRPAVYQGGKRAKVITSEPCCYGVRHLEVWSELSVKSLKEGAWPDQCNSCGWSYRLKVVTNGRLDLGGLIGVKWTSLGFGKDKR